MLVVAGLAWKSLGRSGDELLPYRVLRPGPIVLTTPRVTPTRKQWVLDRLFGGRRVVLPANAQAVLVSPGPRSSTGYGVHILSVRQERRRVVIEAREATPGLEDRVTPHVTYPYRLVMIPATGKHVTVHWKGR